jgi:hypothetical protein
MKNRKRNSKIGNIIIRKEEIRKVKNKGKETKYKINGKEMKKYKKTCYEIKNNKVRKKKTGRMGKRRNKRKGIKNATVKDGKGKRISGICMYGMYGMYSTKGTSTRSADRPPAIRYEKENNKHRPACTQQQYTVQTQLRREYGVDTSCCLKKNVCETKYVIYGIQRTKGSANNGIWCKGWNGILWPLAHNISKTLQVIWIPITDCYISNMENEKGAPMNPDYNLQFPILGQRKGNIIINPLTWLHRECSTKWNRWSSRYRE